MEKSKFSVLMVEDSQDDEGLSLRAASKSGVPSEVKVIRNGSEALATLLALESDIPDLVVLDFHLPDFNGLEILRELRKQKKYQTIPIVMLSGLSSKDTIAEVLAVGASSFVQKPVDAEVYAERVILLLRYWLTVDGRSGKATQ